MPIHSECRLALTHVCFTLQDKLYVYTVHGMIIMSTCVSVVNEGLKPIDICRRLQAHYGDVTLSKTFEWYKHFKEGRTPVNDSAVVHMNNQPVEPLMLENWLITCRQLDASVCGN